MKGWMLSPIFIAIGGVVALTGPFFYANREIILVSVAAGFVSAFIALPRR